MSEITITGNKIPAAAPPEDKRGKLLAFIAGVLVGFLAALAGLTGGV